MYQGIFHKYSNLATKLVKAAPRAGNIIKPSSIKNVKVQKRLDFTVPKMDLGTSQVQQVTRPSSSPSNQSGLLRASKEEIKNPTNQKELLTQSAPIVSEPLSQIVREVSNPERVLHNYLPASLKVISREPSSLVATGIGIPGTSIRAGAGAALRSGIYNKARRVTPNWMGFGKAQDAYKMALDPNLVSNLRNTMDYSGAMKLLGSGSANEKQVLDRLLVDNPKLRELVAYETRYRGASNPYKLVASLSGILNLTPGAGMRSIVTGSKKKLAEGSGRLGLLEAPSIRLGTQVKETIGSDAPLSQIAGVMGYQQAPFRAGWSLKPGVQATGQDTFLNRIVDDLYRETDPRKAQKVMEVLKDLKSGAGRVSQREYAQAMQELGYVTPETMKLVDPTLSGGNLQFRRYRPGTLKRLYRETNPLTDKTDHEAVRGVLERLATVRQRTRTNQLSAGQVVPGYYTPSEMTAMRASERNLGLLRDSLFKKSSVNEVREKIANLKEQLTNSPEYRDRVALWLHDNKGNILVRDDRPKGLGLKLPGGGIDPGQSVNEAAMREALEEVGYQLADKPRALPGVRAKKVDWDPIFLAEAAAKGRHYKGSKHYHRLARAGEVDTSILGSEGDALGGSWMPISEVLEATRSAATNPDNKYNYFDEERLRAAEKVYEMLTNKTASDDSPYRLAYLIGKKLATADFGNTPEIDTSLEEYDNKVVDRVDPKSFVSPENHGNLTPSTNISGYIGETDEVVPDRTFGTNYKRDKLERT